MIDKVMLLAFALFLSLVGTAVPAVAATPPKPLFASQAPLALTIEAPLDRLLRNRASDEAVAGVLTDNAGNRLPVTVQLRGITRRTEDICAFPPLNLRFSAAPPANSPFAGQKKLKVVTHCQNKSSYDRLVLLEYAAYRMFQALSPLGYGARLASIRYQDPGGKVIAAGPAFFLEDLDDLAARNGVPKLTAPPRIPIADLSATDATRYALFQHMLANHDWSMRAGPAGENCCHNAKLVGLAGEGRSIPIPYDFDFSGFVDAPYAQPPAQLDLRSVRQRKYRGYCRHNAEVAAMVKTFRDKRPAIEAELRAVPGLDPRTATGAIAFLNGFFDDIATDQAVEANILKRCVG